MTQGFDERVTHTHPRSCCCCPNPAVSPSLLDCHKLIADCGIVTCCVCGKSEQKRATLLREIASAATFSMPGIWVDSKRTCGR